MTPKNHLSVYAFGNFRLDCDQRALWEGEQLLTLAPRIFDTLRVLVENGGRSVSKERLMQEVWEDNFVEENNLAQNISVLRRMLGDGKGERYIETVPKFGYRFVAEARLVEVEDERTLTYEKVRARIVIQEEYDDEDEAELSGAAPALSGRNARALRSMKPDVRYAQNGNVNIAYQVVGSGAVDLVFVMGWVSHLEYFWEEPRFSSFLEQLASFSRLILFDKRGTGLSDRVPLNQLPTLEQRMEDVHAVMDAVGSQRAVLLGVSEGGPMCSLFAATYPERTVALVMFGTYAKRIRDKDYPWAPTQRQRDAFFDLMQREWGGPVGIEDRAPSLAHDPEFRLWWASYLRSGASPGAAVALTKMNAEIDVRNVLPSVRVPSLVLHRAGDTCLKVEEGRYVASLIPGAKYVELPGPDHLPFVGDQEAVLAEIEDFLKGVGREDDHDRRVLATVLRARLVKPKAQPDAAWNKFIEETRALVERQVELFKGRAIEFDAEGLLAVFDGPARAVRCASSLSEIAERVGLEARIGLHTGECDVIGANYSGVAVEIARSVAGKSGKGEVLASRTVKDLVAGSGLTFSEFGIQDFGDELGEWRLFKVVV
jgi:pimeloyl-ACP methyl ester carboxylesterase/DNA-binding winged helix-turn-helix (wHTH) protein